MTNEQTTGDDGKATFELEYGDYVATITKDGYVTKTENIAFRSNHKNFSITLVEDTPTGTGTVTVTCQDESENKLEGVGVALATDLEDPTTYVGVGATDNTGVCTLMEMDPETYQPTQTVAQIPYGTYSINATDSDGVLTYVSDSFVVDGDEEVTLTLTE